MAGNCPDITPQDETNLILSLLPALPSLDQLAALIFSKIDEIKVKYMGKLSELIARLLETCPPQPEIDKIINIRNNIVTQLNKIYKKISRISDTILKAQKALNVILLAMKVAGGIITASILVQLFAPFIPATVLSKLTAATSGAQEVVDKIKFTSEGEQRLIPIIQAITAVAIAIQLLSNILRNIICKLDALDASLLECSIESTTPPKLLSLSPELISFVEIPESQTTEVDQSSTYRGFIFEIEDVPFSPTVKRIRANALNSDGIVLLQSELSFTTTPNILIEELKLIIDRDNLRAD
jgi:hypothetical protein|tara:strand:+ start:454 stop:1344 length:891 start_codon:yes stop_codon:yes gene_type:complete